MDITLPAHLQYLPLIIAGLVLAYVLYRDSKKSTPAVAPVVPVAPPQPAAPYQVEAPKVEVKIAEPPKTEAPAEAKGLTEQEADKAKATLVAAGVKGTEMLQTLVAVRRGELTAKDVEDAHKDKIPAKEEVK